MKALIVYMLTSMSGLWSIPVKNNPTDLFLIIDKNGKADSYLRINKNCKPIYTRMTGKISYRKCGTHIELSSKPLKVSKKCTVMIKMKVCGKTHNKVFDADGAVLSIHRCGKKSTLQIDRLKGKWKRIGAYGSAPIKSVSI